MTTTWIDTDTETDAQLDDKYDDWAAAYENWSEAFSDEDPYAEDEKPRPDETPASEYCDDEHGTYNPNGGAQSRDAALAAGRCAALLPHWKERYGEPRFCTRLPEAVFVQNGSKRCYEHKDGG